MPHRSNVDVNRYSAVNSDRKFPTLDSHFSSSTIFTTGAGAITRYGIIYPNRLVGSFIIRIRVEGDTANAVALFNPLPVGIIEVILVITVRAADAAQVVFMIPNQGLIVAGCPPAIDHIPVIVIIILLTAIVIGNTMTAIAIIAHAFVVG